MKADDECLIHPAVDESACAHDENGRVGDESSDDDDDDDGEVESLYDSGLGEVAKSDECRSDSDAGCESVLPENTSLDEGEGSRSQNQTVADASGSAASSSKSGAEIQRCTSGASTPTSDISLDSPSSLSEDASEVRQRKALGPTDYPGRHSKNRASAVAKLFPFIRAVFVARGSPPDLDAKEKRLVVRQGMADVSCLKLCLLSLPSFTFLFMLRPRQCSAFFLQVFLFQSTGRMIMESLVLLPVECVTWGVCAMVCFWLVQAKQKKHRLPRD